MDLASVCDGSRVSLSLEKHIINYSRKTQIMDKFLCLLHAPLRVLE